MTDVVYSLGHRLLDFPSARINYLVNASLFIYLVHHPLTLFYGAFITPKVENNGLSFMSDMVFVCLTSFLLYEVHRRIPMLKFLFSRKSQQ